MKAKKQVELTTTHPNYDVDNLGELRRMNVLNPNGEVIGHRIGLVLRQSIADDIHKYPDLVEQLNNISGEFQNVMIEFALREMG